MKVKKKVFVLGLVLGSIGAFPLGVNFGRDAPLLSNPFAKPSGLQDEVIERVRSGTETALEDAREKIHEATRPVVARTD
jgi:hypothetical protein